MQDITDAGYTHTHTYAHTHTYTKRVCERF